MPNFNDMRFDEELIGRLVVAKRSGNALDEMECNQNARVQSTVDRPVQFDSVSDWYRTMKDDARMLEEARIKREQTEAMMQSNMRYHSDWICAKFTKIQ